MNQIFTQRLENLPQEILALPRFFKVRADKRPLTKGWSNPANQKLYSEIDGHKGFDTAGHGKSDDYLFLDFDHVLNDNGEFVTEDAKQLFNRIHDKLKSYCELSASGHGIHIIARPTAGKFKKISSGKNGRIFFNEDQSAFLEIFYGTGGRYCYFTGTVYQCASKAPVTHGEAVDALFQELLDIIADQNKKAPKSATCADTQENTQQRKTSLPMATDDHDRALNMLAVIPVADLSREDWVNVGMALKNNGNSVSDWEQWSRNDERFIAGECETLWQGFSYGGGLTIATIHDLAKKYGYQEPSQYSLPMNGDNKIRTRDRIKDCPANLILPDNFIFGNNKISLVVPPKKDGDEPKYICAARTPIIPTKIFREPMKSKFSYQIAILIRGIWRTTEIDGRTLADPRAIIGLADTGALIDEPKILCRFLNAVISLNPDLPEIKAYSQTGWTDDNFKTFAYPGNESCIIRRAGFDFDKTLSSRGNAELWTKKFIEVLEKGGATAYMYIGTALVAVLARPLNILNPQTHLQGTSGGGKTALQKFAASIFGNPRKLIRTFAATNKNRQLVAAAFCDLPSFIDELETLHGKAAEEQLSNDVYNFADGKGNQANKRNGEARETFEFGGARLTTGERAMLKQHDLRGAYKRLVQLVINGKLLDDDFAAELHIFSESNFGHFGLKWIQFVTEHMQEIQAKYQNHASRRDPTTKPYEPTHLKQISACLVAVEFFKIMLGTAPDFDKYSFIRNWQAIVDSLPTIAEFDDTARSIEALSSYVAAHEKYFLRNVKDSNGDEMTFTFANSTCGKIFDNGEVAFFPTELKRILEDELNFASADKLINEWEAQGILATDKGRATHVIRIGKKLYRTIHFKAEIISTDDDSAELNYYEELGAFE